MPLYEDLVRRALEARERAASLGVEAGRARELASLLRRAHQGEIVLRRCAWCGRLAVADEWLHLEAIGTGQQRIAASLLEHATSGICPDCYRRESEGAEVGRTEPDPSDDSRRREGQEAANGESRPAATRDDRAGEGGTGAPR